MDALINGLKKLGLTEYEARAYVGVLKLGEGTIQDICQAGELPRSRTYDIMRKLAQKGYVEIGAYKPLMYRAIDPNVVTKEMTSEIIRTRDEVLTSLTNLQKKDERSSSPVWMLFDERGIELSVKSLLDRSEKEIVVLAISNGTLLKFSNAISIKSKTSQIKVLIFHDPEQFQGILGNSIILEEDTYDSSSMGWMLDLDFPGKDDERKVMMELVIATDRGSLVIYREDGKKKAMNIDGSILELFLRKSVADFLRHSKQLRPRKVRAEN